MAHCVLFDLWIILICVQSKHAVIALASLQVYLMLRKRGICDSADGLTIPSFLCTKSCTLNCVSLPDQSHSLILDLLSHSHKSRRLICNFALSVKKNGSDIGSNCLCYKSEYFFAISIHPSTLQVFNTPLCSLLPPLQQNFPWPLFEFFTPAPSECVSGEDRCSFFPFIWRARHLENGLRLCHFPSSSIIVMFIQPSVLPTASLTSFLPTSPLSHLARPPFARCHSF